MVEFFWIVSAFFWRVSKLVKRIVIKIITISKTEKIIDVSRARNANKCNYKQHKLKRYFLHFLLF